MLAKNVTYYIKYKIYNKIHSTIQLSLSEVFSLNRLLYLY